MDGVEGVMGEVALGTAGLPAEEAHRFELAQEIGRRLVDVEHAIDDRAIAVCTRGHQGCMGLFQGEIVGDGQRGDAGCELGAVGDALDRFAGQEHARVERAEGFAVGLG